ncbi:MAG TPA: hypothetical protein VE955_09950 [Candidatus Dormibacteraeota bacterium]|jgi:hypothetical protein|nr:hypothetical protein [Candidatus Dormibacteraeota bacterium]
MIPGAIPRLAFYADVVLKCQDSEFTPTNGLGATTMAKIPAKFVTVILAVLVGVEAIALVEEALAPDIAVGAFSFQSITSEAFLVLAPFSPLLIILVLYSWVGRILLKVVSRYDAHGILARRFQFLSRVSQSLPVSWDGSGVLLLSRPLVVLAIGIAASCILAFTPYRLDLNPVGVPVGVDAPEYILWVNQMLRRSPSAALAYAFSQASNGSRPLSLIFPYIVSGLFGVPADVSVKFYPLFLAPLLVVSSFLFVYLGCGDKRTAGLVGLMTAFSFQFTVGMWAGYYANWLALAESYLLLGILVRFTNSGCKTSFLAIAILSIALLFTHPWTWDLVLLLSVVFMTERWVRSGKFSQLRFPVLLVIVNVVADSVKSLALGGYGGGRAGLDIATSSLGFPQFLALWPNVVALFVQNYNELMADSLVLGLALIVIWRTPLASGNFSRLLITWTGLASLPFLFLGSLLQTRIVYFLPIPVLASAALLGLQGGLGRTQRALILSLVLLYEADYALASMQQVLPLP